MFIKLEYNKNNGEMKDSGGVVVGTYYGLENNEVEEEKKVAIDEVVKLKEAGFTSEEIIDMHKKGVI